MAETTSATRPQPILFENEDRSIVLIDVPASVEAAQLPSSKAKVGGSGLKRLLSSTPLDKPFDTPEPKDGTASGLADSVSDLMTAAAAVNALEKLKKAYSGPWCLPRVVKSPGDEGREDSALQKRKREASDGGDAATENGKDERQALIPEDSFYLHGTISSERERFLGEAPSFDLIVLDPPWPNRSARRKKGSYQVADSLEAVRETLSLIPIAALLAPDGLVAVWITNKASVAQLLTGPRGLLVEWGLELIDEWTWLKVTTSGEPIVDINSTWRKPYERILIGRRLGGERTPSCRGKVMVSVPDLHSRKPNLRGLFEDVLPPGYRGLEIFARNLTSGWWSWGDEVLKFQQPGHWVDV